MATAIVNVEAISRFSQASGFASVLEGVEQAAESTRANAGAVVNQATEVRSAVSRALQSCRAALANAGHGEDIAELAAAQEAAAFVLDDGVNRLNQAAAEVKGIEAAWEELFQTGTVLQGIELASTELEERRRQVLERLEPLGPVVEGMRLSLQQLGALLEQLGQEVTEVTNGIQEVVINLSKDVAGIESALDRARQEIMEMTATATSVKQEAKSLLRTLRARRRGDLPAEESEALREELRRQVAALDADASGLSQWQQRAAALHEENARVREALQQLRARKLAGELEDAVARSEAAALSNDASLDRLRRRLDDLQRGLEVVRAEGASSIDVAADSQLRILVDSIDALAARIERQESTLKDLAASLAERVFPADLATTEQLWAAREALRPLEQETVQALDTLESLLREAASLQERQESLVAELEKAENAASADGPSALHAVARELQRHGAELEAALDRGRSTAVRVEIWMREQVMTDAVEKLLHPILAASERLGDLVEKAEEEVASIRTESSKWREIAADAARQLAATLQSGEAASAAVDRVTCHCQEEGRCPLNELGALTTGAERIVQQASVAVGSLESKVQATRSLWPSSSIAAPEYLQPYVARAQDGLHAAEARVKELQKDVSFIAEDLQVFGDQAAATLEAVRDLIERSLGEEMAVVNGVQEQFAAKKATIERMAAEVKQLKEYLEGLAESRNYLDAVFTADAAVARAESVLREVKDELSDMSEVQLAEPEEGVSNACVDNCPLKGTVHEWRGRIETTRAQNAAIVAAARTVVDEVEANVSTAKSLRDSIVSSYESEAADVTAGVTFMKVLTADLHRCLDGLGRARALLGVVEEIQVALPQAGDLVQDESGVVFQALENIEQKLAEAAALTDQCKASLPDMARYKALAGANVHGAAAASDPAASGAETAFQLAVQQSRQVMHELEEVAQAVEAAQSSFLEFCRGAATRTADRSFDAAENSAVEMKELVSDVNDIAQSHAALIQLSTKQQGSSASRDVETEVAALLESANAALAQAERRAKRIQQDVTLIREGVSTVRRAESSLRQALLDGDRSLQLSLTAVDATEDAVRQQLLRASTLVQEMDTAARVIRQLPVNGEIVTASHASKIKQTPEPMVGNDAAPAPPSSAVAAEMKRLSEHQQRAQASLVFLRDRMARLQSANESMEWAVRRQAEAAAKLGRFLQGTRSPETNTEGGRARRLAESEGEASEDSAFLQKNGASASVASRAASLLAIRQDVAVARKAVEDVEKAIEDLSRGQEDAARHVQELEAAARELGTDEQQPTSDPALDTMRRETQQMISDGMQLYKEYGIQLSDLKDRRAKIERAIARQSEVVRELIAGLQMSQTDLFEVSRDQVRRLLTKFETDNENAKRWIKNIRRITTQLASVPDEREAEKARRLVQKVKSVVREIQGTEEVMLEDINTLQTLGLGADAASDDSRDALGVVYQRARAEADSLRQRLSKLTRNIRAREREADESLLHRLEAISLLHSLDFAIQHMQHTSTQAETRKAALGDALARIGRMSAALEKAGGDAHSSGSTADAAFWIKTAADVSAFRSRAEEARAQATALIGGAEAFLRVAFEDVKDARGVLSQCKVDLEPVLVSRCVGLEAMLGAVASTTLPGLEASVMETLEKMKVMRQAQHALQEALIAHAKEALLVNVQKASEVSARSNDVLREIRDTVNEMQQAVARAGLKAGAARRTPQQVGDAAAVAERDVDAEAKLIKSLQRMAEHGAALAKNLSIAADAMRATLVPTAIVEVLPDASLAASVNQHAKDVEAQTRAWNAEAASMVAEMQDIVGELQRTYQTVTQSWVRHEVTAYLAVVSALLRKAELDRGDEAAPVSELFRSAVLLKRANSLLRSVPGPWTDDAAADDRRAGLVQKAHDLGQKLESLMDRHQLSKFEGVVLSTGSALRSVDDAALPSNVKNALAALGRTQAEAARLLRMRSKLPQMGSKERARSQQELRSHLNLVARQTKEALSMLESVMLNEKQKGDSKTQRLISSLTQGVELASQIARDVSEKAGSGGDADRASALARIRALQKQGEYPVAVKEELSDAFERTAVLLEHVRREAERGDGAYAAGSPADQSQEMPEAVEGLRRLIKDMDERNQGMKQSLEAALKALQKAHGAVREMNAQRSVAAVPADGDEVPAAYVEKLTHIMEAADNDRRNLEVGLGIGLGIVLFLLVIVSVVFVFVKRRLSRRLSVLSRTDDSFDKEASAQVAAPSQQSN